MAIYKLKKCSILDKKEKLKTKKLAENVVKDLDLEEVFKEEPKEEEKKDEYWGESVSY